MRKESILWTRTERLSHLSLIRIVLARLLDILNETEKLSSRVPFLFQNLLERKLALQIPKHLTNDRHIDLQFHDLSLRQLANE